MREVLKVGVVVAAVVVLDCLALRLWPSVAPTLGAFAGLEIGLVIFLNALTLLFVIDCLESVVRLPGFGWYYELPCTRADCSPRRRGPHAAPPPPARPDEVPRWRRLVTRTAVLTLVYYLLETLLFPFVPAGDGVELELLMVGSGVFWQLVSPDSAPVSS